MSQYRQGGFRFVCMAALVAVAVACVGGCGDEPAATQKPAKPTNGGGKKRSTASSYDEANREREARKREMLKRLKEPEPEPPRGMAPRKTPRTFSDLLEEPDGSSAAGEVAGDDTAEKPLDDAAIAAAGLRKITGKHLTLITDVPSSAAVDELPRVFDLAVPQWVEYFKLDEKKLNGWNLRAVLMKDKEKFKAAGLLPDGLPEFLNGYARAGVVWFYDQTSDYYRRHLLLHEGTHAAMYTALGRAGPPWYSEGMAEYLATHRWADGKLTLRYFPRDPQETPGLGRIKIVRDEFAAGRSLPLSAVLAYDSTAHRQNEPYAWSWAAVTFLDSHPRYRDQFRRLLADVELNDGAFNVALRGLFETDLAQMQEEWQLFVAALEHGYDFEKTAVDFTPGVELSTGGQSITVAADRGWQNSGVRLTAGQTYRLTASGRYQVADQPRVWWSEPGGVSIRYYQGRPLGVLLAAVRPDGDGVAPLDGGQPSALLQPTTIGLGAELAPAQSGTLYFKVNDSAGELGDNEGNLTVNVEPKS
ncbi:MAG: hypothetical protein WD875_01950 [Pirellulales bacterium]